MLKELRLFRKLIIGAWIFFMLLSFTGETPHGPLFLIFVSLMFSIAVTVIAVFYTKTQIHKEK